ncbi:MAG: SpoVR family protein [Bacillati bacterium ANGP1]|uniref:SpoVR family protein n=1 Tax=Candidatus Segetimicrobium genomatis TaxID=2569760 RepID=A0A537JLA9_9BACT|nr:MAG: SpoVR family protein [Terrabacteria group bacterium ANGP1]
MIGEYQTVIRELEGLAHDRGLEFDPVVFQITDSDDLAQVASMGLPNRFMHWYWGGTYKELVMQQTKEVFSILELVLNTTPSHAFLRSTNSYLQNVLVIAHVLGHADFFANNHWYQKSNKNMLNIAEQHARQIRAYEAQHGRERVEKLLDALLTVAPSVAARGVRAGPARGDPGRSRVLRPHPADPHHQRGVGDVRRGGAPQPPAQREGMGEHLGAALQPAGAVHHRLHAVRPRPGSGWVRPGARAPPVLRRRESDR